MMTRWAASSKFIGHSVGGETSRPFWDCPLNSDNHSRCRPTAESQEQARQWRVIFRFTTSLQIDRVTLRASSRQFGHFNGVAFAESLIGSRCDDRFGKQQRFAPSNVSSFLCVKNGAEYAPLLRPNSYLP